MRIQVIDDDKGEVASVAMEWEASAEDALKSLIQSQKACEVISFCKAITVAPLASEPPPAQPQFKFEIGQRVRLTKEYMDECRLLGLTEVVGPVTDRFANNSYRVYRFGTKDKEFTYCESQLEPAP